MTILFFNTRDEALKEKPLRQALALATPKAEILKSSTGTKGQLAYNSFAAVDYLGIGGKEKYDYNLAKASQLLTNLGWELKDNFRYKAGKKLALTITTLADTDLVDSAKKIRDSWRQLGIDAGINIVSGIEMREQTVPNRNFTVLLSSQLLSSDPDQYVLWHTTQVKDANVTGITSPKLDKLLEDGRRTLDEATRRDKYQEFSRLLLDESPAVFLYYPKYVWILSNRVKNIDLTNFREPQDRFLGSAKWEIDKPFY